VKWKSAKRAYKSDTEGESRKSGKFKCAVVWVKRAGESFLSWINEREEVYSALKSEAMLVAVGVKNLKGSTGELKKKKNIDYFDAGGRGTIESSVENENKAV